MKGGKHMRVAIVLVLASSALVSGLVACSEGGDDAAPETTGAEAGAGLPPASDAGVDAPVDAARDAADAAPRLCSNDDFCHTTVSPKANLRAVWDDGAGTAWTVSDQGKVYRFDGTTWQEHATLGSDPLAAVWGSGPTDVWIGGDAGLFHGTGATPAQLVFTKVDVPGPGSPILSIWGTGPSDVWAVGGRFEFPLVGRVLHYAPLPPKGGDTTDAGDAGSDAGTDAGAPKPEWSLVDLTKDSVEPLSVFGSSASGVWIGVRRFDKTNFDYDIALFRFAPGARGFEELPLPSAPSAGDPHFGGFERLYGASASPDGKAVALLGRTHSAVPSVIRGAATDPAGSFPLAFGADGTYQDPEMHGVWAASPDDVWTAGEYGRLRHWDGTGWKQAAITNTKYPVIAPLWALWGDAKGRMWCVGDGIALHRDPPLPKP